jgi:osmotically-inducible protein OsmY
VKRTLLLLAVAILALSANVFAAKNPARSPDAELAGRVRGALHAHFGPTAKEIDVLVRDGFVFLYGAVPSDSLRVRAERVAAAVPGVRAVDNELAVASAS